MTPWRRLHGIGGGVEVERAPGQAECALMPVPTTPGHLPPPPPSLQPSPHVPSASTRSKHRNCSNRPPTLPSDHLTPVLASSLLALLTAAGRSQAQGPIRWGTHQRQAPFVTHNTAPNHHGSPQSCFWPPLLPTGWMRRSKRSSSPNSRMC